MEEKELIDFSNWLLDMDMLKINGQIQPFMDAEDLARYYIKVRQIDTSKKTPSSSANE